MAKKKKRIRARDLGEVKLLTVEIEPLLYEAIEDCMKRDRRSKRAVVELALEKYLKDQGFWPPPSE